MTKRAVNESDVLKPKNPSLTDEDDWEEFTLSNVEVYSPVDDTLVDLVAAEEGKPVVVVGKLERLSTHLQQYLYDKFALPVKIRVTDVQRFAYGQYDDGEIALWAAGGAGWFKIRPARNYKAIYRDMVEATTLLYFLVDLFGVTKNKKKLGVSLDRVLKSISDEPELHCADTTEADALVLKHRMFLYKCMTKKKEGVEWSATSLFAYLEQQMVSTPDADHTPKNQTNDDTDDPDEINAARLARKGKSALRPRSGKFSMKGKKASNIVETDEDAMDIDVSPKPARESSPLKRKNSASHQSSRQKRAQTDELTSHQDTDSSNGPVVDPVPLPLPARPSPSSRRHRGGKPNNTSLKIVEEPLPSFEPKGPGDTWTCTFDGCAHRVYAASTPQGRTFIKEHFHTHTIEKQAQLDLVFQEERPYLPVGNLIKRIRDMAAQDTSIGVTKGGVGG